MSLKCVLDLETTGFSPKTDDIIQFSAVIVDEEYRIQEVYNKRYASARISQRILDLLDLTLEEYQELHTGNFVEDIPSVLTFLQKTNYSFYAYSNSFDKNMLNGNLARFGYTVTTTQVNLMPKQKIALGDNLKARGYNFDELLQFTKQYFPNAKGFHDATLDTIGALCIMRDEGM